LITFATAGIAFEVAAMLDGGKIAVWIAEMIPVAAKFIRVLLLMIDPIATAAIDEATFVKIVTVLVEIMDIFVQVFVDIYDVVINDIIKPLIQILAEFTPGFIKQMLGWLKTINRMADQALIRFMQYILSKFPQESFIVQRVTQWLAYAATAATAEAIKEFFEAAENADKIADGAREAAIIAAVFNDTGAPLLIRVFPKYGSQAEPVLLAIKATFDDQTFANKTVTKVVEAIADDRLPVSSPQSVRGMAWTIQKECPVLP
jgi:hypothetical protein